MGKSMKKRRILVGVIFVLLWLVSIVGLVDEGITEASGSVLVVNFDGQITSATYEMFKDVIETAEETNANLTVFMINTLGGELGAIDDIMTLFSNSKVPVAVFVYPKGATAVSGGTYILMASHIAVMSAGSTIGSCRPVDQYGYPVTDDKVINFLVAKMRSLAIHHSRNETAAVEFILSNLNLIAEEALEYGVIEFVVYSTADITTALNELFLKLEDKVLIEVEEEVLGNVTPVWKIVDKNAVLEEEKIIKKYSFAGISNKDVVIYMKGTRYALLQMLSDPLIVSILLTIGIYSLIFGLVTPGVGAELVGSICLLLSLVGLGVIGVSVASIMFLLIGVSLFIAELKTNVGAFAVGGSICILIGILLIIPPFAPFEYRGWYVPAAFYTTFRILALGITGLTSALFGFIIYKGLEAKRLRKEFDIDLLIGKVGYAKTDITSDLKGIVYVEGEEWSAKTDEEFIATGDKIKVIGVEGLTLIVKSVGQRSKE
jgi:membrane-bound serine protease (ClpP class)